MVVLPVPYAYGVDFSAWIVTLEEVAALQPRLLVPGHGAVQEGGRCVSSLQELFRATLRAVHAAADRGLDLEAILAEVKLEPQAARFASHSDAALS